MLERTGSRVAEEMAGPDERPLATAGQSRKRPPRWHHRPQIRSALAWLIAGYIRLVDRTGRWQLIFPEATADLVREGRPFIFAFWHGRLQMIHPAWRRLRAAIGDDRPPQPHVISSSHGDGQLIQLATSRFGLKTLWGSSRRGGARVLREAARVLNEGGIVVITPDGPRGPRMRAHPGIAYLAASAGVPVVPIAFAAKRSRVIASWDRFMLAPPFSSGVLAFGKPLHLPAEGDIESHRRFVEERMIAFALDIDRSQGIEPIRPAEPAA